MGGLIPNKGFMNRIILGSRHDKRANGRADGKTRQAWRRMARLGTLLAWTCAHAVSMAQEPVPASGEPDAPGWTFVLGAGASYGPDYIGSDDREVQPFPFILAEYKDLFYVHGPTVGYNFLRMDGLTVSLAGRYQMYGDRSAKDNRQLRGLEDIDAGFDVGLVARQELDPWSIGLSVFKDVSDTHDGAIVELDVDHKFELSGGLQAEVGLNLMWADQNVQQTYFGITPRQSAASGLRPHQAGAGLLSAGLGIGVKYAVTRNWQFLGKLDVDRLLGDAADSPLVKDIGSATQPRLSLILGYRF